MLSGANKSLSVVVRSCPPLYNEFVTNLMFEMKLVSFNYVTNYVTIRRVQTNHIVQMAKAHDTADVHVSFITL